MAEIKIVVPLTPVSVNHYKMRTRRGVTFVSAEAKAYKDAVILMARGKSIRAKEYAVTIAIYLGKGQKGDVDNFAKLPLDALVAAGVIHSDAAVTDLRLRKSRDEANPRTEITIQEV